jgi:hypothetical protein
MTIDQIIQKIEPSYAQVEPNFYNAENYTSYLKENIMQAWNSACDSAVNCLDEAAIAAAILGAVIYAGNKIYKKAKKN